MRRWLLLCLFVLMPLQSAWSAASAYCTHHEQGGDATHWGHHNDGHDNLTSELDVAYSGSVTTENQAHPHHHGGVPALLPVILDYFPVSLGFEDLRYVSPPRLDPAPTQIERPQWLGFA